MTLVTIWLYIRSDQEFLPPEDKGRLLAVGIAPEGASAEYTDRMLAQAERIVAEMLETDMYFAAFALGRAGPGRPNETFMFIRFKEGDRKNICDLLAGPKGLAVRMISGVKVMLSFPIVPKAVTRGSGQPLQLVIQDHDPNRLEGVVQQVMSRLRSENFLLNLRSNFEFSKPELRIFVDRD